MQHLAELINPKNNEVKKTSIIQGTYTEAEEKIKTLNNSIKSSCYWKISIINY